MPDQVFQYGDDGQKKRISPESFPLTTVTGSIGKRMDMRELMVVEDERRIARVLSDPNFMRVYISYVRLGGTVPVTSDELKLLLKKAGVTFGVDDESVGLLAGKINSSSEPVGLFDVARGDPPKAGKDGWLELMAQPLSRDANYDADEDGNIDYHDLHLFENVIKGQVVAVVHEPGKGKPGVDVLGQYFPAADGKNASYSIGKNVREGDAPNQLVAVENGFLEWDGRRLSLQTVYTVHGDVDYKVGHIDFIGDVIVQGQILDDFNVRGRKSVTIHGQVGRCQIESEGDVVIMGGMAGKTDGCIISGGNVKAKYIDETIVDAIGDVEVRNEIVGSNIRARGMIDISNGNILGGSVMAYRGVVADVIGSELGVTTNVTAGIDWTSEEEVARLNERIAEFCEQVSATNAELLPLLDQDPEFYKLPEAEQDNLRGLISCLKNMRNNLVEMERERDSHLNLRRDTQVRQVNVNSRLFSGVCLRFTRFDMVTKDSFRGPLSVVEDLSKSMVRIVEQFELSEDGKSGRTSSGDFSDINA